MESFGGRLMPMDHPQFSAEPSGRSVRNHAIDNLRAVMICVVMFGHAMLPYVTVPRHFKDPSAHIAFDVVGLFLYSFAMPLFFVTAGFAAAAMLQQRGLQGLVRNRCQSILLPLLVAYVVLTPLTRAAYVFAKQASETGSLNSAFELLLMGDWLRWSKAYHLWFLVALLLYTALALGLRGLLMRLPSRKIEQAFRVAVFSPWRLAWLAIFGALSLIPAYTLHDGDATTLPMQLHLFGFFLLGWLLFLHRDVLASMAGTAWHSIAIAMLFTPLAAWAARQRWMAPDQVDLLHGSLAGGAYAVVVAGTSIGFLGLFHARFNNRSSALGQYISDASYWIFLIHLPLLIFVAGALSVTPLGAFSKYLLSVMTVVPLVLGSYHLAIRSTAFGRLLKGRKADRS